MARLATGKARTLGGGRKAWTARLDAPTERYPRYRVHFKEPVDDQWVWTTRSPRESTHEAAMALFAETEAWLDGVRDHAPARSAVTGTRTVAALGDLMLAEARSDLSARTAEGRESMLRKHIVPAIGKVQAARWRLEHTKKVMDAAAQTCGEARLSDLRTVLSVMRGIAHREGWLDPSINPLGGLKLAKVQRLHGAGKGFVPDELRPERSMVDAVARAADRLVEESHQSFARFPYLGSMYRVAGYGGLRLGEQLGLRVWDVFPDKGYVLVNGSWTQPRAADADAFRGPVKNGRVHEVPLPASVMAELVALCRTKLGLGAEATRQQVVNAQRAERLARGRAVGDPTRWWEHQVDAADELWLWTDTTTGLPPRSETHNHYWHKTRRWVSEHDAEHEWPESITYRNMRHHAATFWHDAIGREWVDVAAYLGDELTTVLSHYVRPGAKALEETIGQLASW